MPLKFKHSSLGHIERQKKANQNLSMSLSLNKSSSSHAHNPKSLKIQLPPVPSQHKNLLKNSSKIINSSHLITNK